MSYKIGRSWRDSATLMVLNRRGRELPPRSNHREDVNYDILLQTRTRSASFPNSVVFPGGVQEPADSADSWRLLLNSFGYSTQDFESLHHIGTTLTPLFKDSPVQRHVSLRITAIRETFEELGLLICSSDSKHNRSGHLASVLNDVDVKHWQERISTNPGDLYTLCQEYKCYPDIWSLHYWSSWLTPAQVPKRFSTAFFVTALENKPPGLRSNSEVTKVEWSNPLEVLDRPDVVLYPPQVYELSRLSHVKDIDQLITFAKERSNYGEPIFFPVIVKAKDGVLHLLPGDDLYPSSVDYESKVIKVIDQSLAELRQTSQTIHRLETYKNDKPKYIIKNYKPEKHINMGDVTLSNITINH